MESSEFNFVCDLLKKRSGLVLGPDKTYLVESRLSPVARRLGLTTVGEVIAKVKSAGDPELLMIVTEAMATNESYFFRDKAPFEMLTKTVLPQMSRRRAKGETLRIWSAAASSGQEPYSLAMAWIENRMKADGLEPEILGTDLSRSILKKAEEAKYSQFEVQRGLPITLLVKYFKQEGENWILNRNIREMVKFRQFNLLDDFRCLGMWDVVFCRNVLIYFDPQTKADILERIARQMAPDGFLFLGAAESVFGITDAFESVPGQRGLYQPAAAGKRASAAAGRPVMARAASAS